MFRVGCQLNKIARRTNKQQLLILRRKHYEPPKNEYVEKPKRNIFQYVLAVGCVIVIEGVIYYVYSENHKSVLKSMIEKHRNFVVLMNKGEIELKLKDYKGVHLYF